MSDLIDRQAAIDALRDATFDFEACEIVLKQLSPAQLGTDCISRQAVMDAINRIECTKYTTWYEFYQKVITAVGKLPPAEPKRGKWIKTARWDRVYYCNQCRNYLDFDGVNAGRGSTNFCPNCGSRNEVTT